MESVLLNETFAGRHSMDSPEWYTPAPIVEAARRVLGAIDLDPASHEEANRTVKAARYFTEADNGLVQEWEGRVFINPPGGLVGEFWKKLLASPGVTEAIWIGYSLEQLQTLQCVGAGMTPLEWPMCVTRKRIAFVENEEKKAARRAKLIAAGKKPNAASSPSHSNYISYVGYEHHDAFVAEFSKFGQVVIR
jgi:hypothetical protein